MKKMFLVVVILSILISCEKDKIEDQVLVENINSTDLLNIPIIYEPTDVQVSVDTNFDIDSIIVYFNDNVIINQKGTTNVNFNFDPEMYSTGEAIVKIEVVQAGGNVTSKEYPIIIHRKLLDIDLDSYFFRKGHEDFFLFASATDGSILASKVIETLPISFALTTEKDIERETPYQLTLASRYVSDDIEIVILKSINDITRSYLDRFSPKSPKRREIEKQWQLNTLGFSENMANLGGNSSDYSYALDGLNFTFGLTKYKNLNGIEATEDFYLRAFNGTNSEYLYKWIDENDLNNDIVLNIDDFSNQNLIRADVDVSYVDGFENGHDWNLGIYGYLNNDDFSTNTNHQIWLSGRHTTQTADMYINPVGRYVLNTSFYKYAHYLHLEDYLTVRRGTPSENYDIPDWQLDFEIVDKKITFNINGDGHSVGKVLVSSGNITDELPIIEGKKVLYLWDVCFNSVDKLSLTLPEFPEELKSWSFGKFYETSTPKIKWARIERYENIPDYSQYLNTIIKENNEPLQISPLFEAKFKSYEEFNYFSFNLNDFFN